MPSENVGGAGCGGVVAEAVEDVVLVVEDVDVVVVAVVVAGVVVTGAVVVDVDDELWVD